MKVISILTLVLLASCGYSPRHDRHEANTTINECQKDWGCNSPSDCQDPCEKQEDQYQSQQQDQRQKVIIELPPYQEPVRNNEDINIVIDIDNKDCIDVDASSDVDVRCIKPQPKPKPQPPKKDPCDPWEQDDCDPTDQNANNNTNINNNNNVNNNRMAINCC